jgi:hypothetical protein
VSHLIFGVLLILAGGAFYAKGLLSLEHDRWGFYLVSILLFTIISGSGLWILLSLVP